MLKKINKDTVFLVVTTVLLMAALFMVSRAPGVSDIQNAPEYQGRLFDSSYMHHIDIEMADWEHMLSQPDEKSGLFQPVS